MHSFDPLPAYFHVADDLFSHRIHERDVSGIASKLPPLDETLLHRLGQQAEALAGTRPRRGWAITRVAHGVAMHQEQPLFLRALAAWYLARASNYWARPKRVAAAVSQARRAFVKLNEPGWAAACDWQLNALPWTKPDFEAASKTLYRALEHLEQAGFDEFVPHCRLSLAYAQILIKEYEEAQENIRVSERTFVEKVDPLNQARCWLHEASYLRRADRFEQALAKLEQAGLVFEKMNAPADRAKAHYQTGLCYLMRTDNLEAATQQIKQAIELFSTCDLELWKAMCVSNLGSVYLFTGELALADRHYEESRKVFARHKVLGLLADNLLDCGEVNILRGRPHTSIEQFKHAAELNEKLGVPLPAAIAITNLGKAYGQSGRYQDALYYLEQSAARLESLESYLRLGTCEKYMALVWSQLGQPALAHEYLDRATRNYELADQNALLPEVYSYRARACFQQGMEADAIQWLEKSLAAAERYQVRPQAILAKRLLGEALFRAGRYQEALQNLRRAQKEAKHVGMLAEQAASLVACGNCYALLSEAEQAQRAFEQVLQFGLDAWPEIEWRAYIGLGDLAASQGDLVKAIQAYRRGTESFAQIRQNFWQPSLVGPYLQGSSRIFDRIISFASDSGSAPETLFLVEQGKASTFLQQVAAEDQQGWNPTSQQMDDLQAQIGFWQDRLATLIENSFSAQATSEFRQVRHTLHEKVRAYGELKARLERQKIAGHTALAGLPTGFDISSFRALANEVLKGNWLALDFYFAGDQLITIAVGRDLCDIVSSPVSHRSSMALDAFEKARRNPEYPDPSDLHALGKLLIPNLLQKYIDPETYLLVAPHRKLHTVPWAALRPEFASEPLACVCIPTVVPSLQSLAVLWQRERSKLEHGGDAGVLVGVSKFRNRHPDLPQVKNEIQALRSRVELNAQHLSEEEATWANLLQLSRGRAPTEQKGLSRFAWLHVASHFSSDAFTGRLSGVALWDRDITLDQLRDLVRLPRLVTISACNSNASFVYEGDEHVDLPTTCLIAGASSVIGSMWPIADQPASRLMTAFYHHYRSGMSPARAVAQVQREFAQDRTEEKHWASFMCIGIP